MEPPITNCAIWRSVMTYQKVNSSMVSKSAMNCFNEMFSLARMFLLAIMHTPCIAYPSPVPIFQIMSKICLLWENFEYSNFPHPVNNYLTCYFCQWSFWTSLHEERFTQSNYQEVDTKRCFFWFTGEMFGCEC